MVGKKQGSKAALREEGLAKTDNSMPLTSWPMINPINQKNYYTEYLKRDEQYLAFRGDDIGHQSQQSDAQTKAQDGTGTPAEAMDVDGEELPEGAEQTGEALGSKTVVLHPGSQNLRIGLGSDALPKTIPMVIARRSDTNESDEDGADIRPRRIPHDDFPWQREKWFPQEWGSEFGAMSTELKQHMRNMKLRLMPNNKELVVNYNRKASPDTISEHNDPLRIEWTEFSPSNAPDYICGNAALRIPDDSKPRYKLKWPIQNGWFNEQGYESKNVLMHDYHLILEEAIKSELGLKQKDLAQYECVFIIPDLYEKIYGITTLAILLRGIGFRRACFIQESVAATYGAGYLSGCIVDIGAQKTSISCVEDGMIIENSRINMKYGGMDVTDTFMKMMLYDYFPYSEINLNRRYDFLLAEELKQQHCTMKETDVSVVAHDFHLRVSGQDTYKYTFKSYDETLLAPMGYFRPSIFDHTSKLNDRRTLIDRSYDLYDGSPNDPLSNAQISVLQASPGAPTTNGLINGTSSPSLKRTGGPLTVASRLLENENTPRSSVAGSPAPEGTPQPSGGARDSPAAGGEGGGAGDKPAVPIKDPVEEKLEAAEERDAILPIMPLDQAVWTSVINASSDNRKMGEYLGAITVVGGGGKLSNFNTFLEERLKKKYPGFVNSIMISEAPRELDAQVVVWKGGSIFGKLGTNDSWVSQREFDWLGHRVLTQKCLFVW